MVVEPEPIRAAGVVCLREGPHGPEALLIHRNRRNDWSLPKGKLEPGEHVAAAAVREVAEETGYDVVLGPPLATQQYPVADRQKIVHYWLAHARGRGPWLPGIEVDLVRWVGVADAEGLLTYPHDGDLVREALTVPRGTVPFVLLRHATAEKRHDYAERHDGKPPPDGERPLSRVGEAQALDLVPVLTAFGISRVTTSDAVRCVTTVSPYAQLRGIDVGLEPTLSETGYTRHPRAALRRIESLVATPDPMVFCTHRPLLPALVRRIQKVTGVKRLPRALSPGEFVVLHRRFEGGKVRVEAVEQHEP